MEQVYYIHVIISLGLQFWKQLYSNPWHSSVLYDHNIESQEIFRKAKKVNTDREDSLKAIYQDHDRGRYIS